MRIQQLADVIGVAQRIAGALRGAGDGAGFDAVAFHAHEHFGRRADQLLIAELQEEFVGAGAGVLHVSNSSDGLPEYGVRNVWRSTTS